MYRDISIFGRVETGVGGSQKETIGKRIPAFHILSLFSVWDAGTRLEKLQKIFLKWSRK